MHTWAIVLAAGASSRLAAGGVATPKQFLLMDGLPLFWRGALTFSRLAALRGIVFVFPQKDADAMTAVLRDLDAGGGLGLPFRVACGGARRQDSVREALASLPPECDAVLVHDAARPFASAALAVRVLEALERGAPAVVPGIAVSDTIKCVDACGLVRETYERSALRAVQTPQGFRLAPLRAAHARAEEEGWEVTDDAALMERCGVPVRVVEGEEGNRKLTTVDDLALLRPARQEAPALPRTGLGYDVHRYGGTRPFILGGVPIPTDIRIEAHSDGDTLLHALMDALLACVCQGDIGALFPDSDPAFDNISSGVLLAEVLERTRLAGLSILHVDITVVAQTPRVAPHRKAIADNVAKMLGLAANAVNVKATTEEKLGFTGEKKGIKVIALVSAVTAVLPTAS